MGKNNGAIPEFTSFDYYEERDMGCYVIELDEVWEDASKVNNKEVIIDNNRLLCRGIQCNHLPPFLRGDLIVLVTYLQKIVELKIPLPNRYTSSK